MRLVLFTTILLLAACKNGGNSDFGFVGGDDSNKNDKQIVLTSISDQVIDRAVEFSVDISEELSGSDEGMTYECIFDLIKDDRVSIGLPCDSLPGVPASKFDPSSGVLVWTPNNLADTTYEIRVTGTKDGLSDEEIFVLAVVDAIRLTPGRDREILRLAAFTFDTNNQATNSDVGLTYECLFDTDADGAISVANSCNGLPGTPATKFNTTTGVLTWTPSAAADGDYEIRIRGVATDGRYDDEYFVLTVVDETSGTVGNSAIDFDPVTEDFGPLAVFDDSSIEQFTLTNTADQPLYIDAIEESNPHFSIIFSTCPLSPTGIAPAATCIIGVQFSPQTSGYLGTSITAKYGIDAANDRAFSSVLSVSGLGVGNLTFAGITSISPVTHTRATLNWASTPEAKAFTIFKVESSGSLTFVEQIVNTSGTVVNYQVINLTPNTTYKFRVRATDALGISETNTTDVTVTTASNRLPDLAAISNPSAFTGVAMSSVDANDSTNNNDFDIDLDPITYSCKYDNTIDGLVSFSTAANCTSLTNEGGGNPTFNASTGVLSGWIPLTAQIGTSYEFAIRGADTFNGQDTVYFSTTVQAGLPAVTELNDLLFPTNAVAPGGSVTFDVNNVRFGLNNDVGMTYSCVFDRTVSGTVASGTNCSSLPGTLTFSTSAGTFSWTPSSDAFGPYEIKFTGSNGGGSDDEIVVVQVRSAYSTNNLLVYYDPMFARTDGGAGINSPFTSTWPNLLVALGTSTLDLSSFAATVFSGWAGSLPNTSSGDISSPHRLVLDGSDDKISLGTGLNSNTRLFLDTWVMPSDVTVQEATIVGSRDGTGKGAEIRQDSLGTGYLEASPYSDFYSEVMADNPILYFRFNETTGAVVTNEVSGGTNGTITNTSDVTLGDTAYVRYANNKAMTFNSNGNITLNSNLAVGGNWTISAWFKYPLATTGNTWNTLVRGSANDHQVIVQRSNNHLGGYIGGSFRTTNFVMTTLSSGWHHLGCVVSGGNSYYYIDGVLVGSIAQRSNLALRWIGNYNAAQPWGTIDEIAIFGDALSEARIKAHYLAATPCRSTTKLVNNVWTNLQLLIDNSALSLTMYFNGVQQCTMSYPSSLASSSAALTLGGQPDGSQSWQGAFGEVRAYSAGSASVALANTQATSRKYIEVPQEITGLQVWLDASKITGLSDGAKVSSWPDSSGNGRNATQAVSGQQPVYKTNQIGTSKPVVRFTSASSTALNDVYSYTARTAFIIYRVSSTLQSTSQLGQLWGNYGSGTGYHVAIDPRSSGRGLSFDGAGGTTARYALNGTAYSSAMANQTSNVWTYDTWNMIAVEYSADVSVARQVIGSTEPSLAGHYFGGDIAEIIIYDRVLSSTERARVESYLTTKYGL